MVYKQFFFVFLKTAIAVFFLFMDAKLLGFISSSLSALPFIVALIYIKKIKAYLIPVFVLAIVNASVEVLINIYVEIGRGTNEILHVFTIIEFCLISLFFASFFKKYFNPRIIYSLIPSFCVLAYLDYKINGLNTTVSLSLILESFILVVYTLFFYYYVLKNLIFENLLSQPVFWVCTAILFYFSGNFVLFVCGKYMARVDLDKYVIFWTIIHTFFNLLYNVFLSLGFWKARIK
jgi:hypothetical protein